ncbi:MAG: hydrogenase maturation nickel metallochaperone HypA [Longimicrobiales bacterium]|nr:hydrogenase maturation nickel metallochaperone HypA [Longimicrobiales bacterium]
MSLALEVCRITRERAGSGGCEKVSKVGIEVGDQSGVEADNLLFWLEILLAEPPFKGASPVVHPRKGDVLRVSYLEVEDGGKED